MNPPSLVSATSIVLLLSGALLSGCAATTPRVARCDTTQAVGSCAVTVQTQGSKLVVCPVQNAAASPVCMNAALDVKRPGQQTQQMKVMLKPGQCQPLSSEVMSATPASCEAFAPSARETPPTASAAETH